MTRTEYGALVVSQSNNVYVKAFVKAVVVAWMAEHAAVTPVLLVTRQWNGDTHTRWEIAA